jgi:predicted ATPase
MSTFAGADAHLPTYLTRFVGREREVALLSRLVAGAAVPGGPLMPDRLITLTGVGGCGKTRLASEVALAFCHTEDTPHSGHGVRWVDLAPVTEAEDVPRVIARALRLPEAAGVKPLQALISALEAQHLLLIMDNCEHLIEACAQVATAVLADCPRVTLLLTSRSALHVCEETVLAVPPLETEAIGHVSPGGSPGPSEAIELFWDRATMGAQFTPSTVETAEVITAICQRLGGSPLAIELAASWMRVLTARDLLAEIDSSIDVLSSSAPGLADRHRSMRAVLES